MCIRDRRPATRSQPACADCAAVVARVVTPRPRRQQRRLTPYFPLSLTLCAPTPACRVHNVRLTGELAFAAGLPEHVAVLAVRISREDEEQVTQPIQVLRGQ